MAAEWYSVIREDLASVDDIMAAEVRSAYPELDKMCKTLLTADIHKVRPAMCILSYYANGGTDSDKICHLAACFESSFEALHLHATVGNDGKVSNLRKKLFGPNMSSTTKVVVAGDFMYVMGFRQAYGNVPDAVPYLMEASASISDGIFDAEDNEFNAAVTEEDCIRIMKEKDAVELKIMMGAAADTAGSDNIEMMKECGECIGLALQITADTDEFGRGETESLRSGRATIPLFFALKDSIAGPAVSDMLNNRDPSDEDVKKAFNAIVKSGALEKSRGLSREFAGKAADIAKGLPDTPYRQALLDFIDMM